VGFQLNGVNKMTNKPQRKPPHDLSIRLGNKKALKAKLQKIAGKNDLSMNQLLIFLIESWLSNYEKGKRVSRELK
jgi:hypothetical protein